MRHFEGQGAVVPTSAGLRPALMAKKLDLQAGTEAEAFAFADVDKPWGAGGECFYIGALGHEKDPIGGERRK